MIRTLPPSARDAALLVARLVLGVVLVAHGWQKVVTNGLGATAEGFAGMGVPLAPVSAAFAGLVELVGGVLLVAGAATALVGVLVVLDMIGAALLVHAANGVFASDGGWELVGVIGALALVLAAVGAGRFSVDHALASRRRTAAV
ncbi:DoxX family protein [Pseudonocardia kunmingensis]|uniref:Putative oxidoreductase n=1 Tax=Pseudonocardia kunmingensis TaxID=630975 RepID=A0A543DYS8_9PSEU|nr:DoxX family protein [Pseudonocardia kunmingensis]TQM14466.1 putative oxidoreductase [Pseudonocardia kunmingensis]